MNYVVALLSMVVITNFGGNMVVMAMPPNPGFVHITPGCLRPDENHFDLWCPGDGGYECYKIPSLLRVPNTTTLLAFIEARKHSCDDAGYIDILLRRSQDNGKTWSSPQMVYGNSTESEWHTIGDALPVYDAVGGVVHLVFTRDNTDAFVTMSTDVGQTWAIPQNISDAVVLKRGKFLGTGHAGGLQLATGRLLVPMYGGGSHSFVVMSDDHGKSWRKGGELDASPNEWVMAEVTKGTGKLIGSLRSFPHRRQAYSNDGGLTWSPTIVMKSLPEPLTGCEGALILHPNGRLYYSHPDQQVLRNVMNIKVSDDGGKTWQQHSTIWGPGHGCDKPCVPAASYSSMVALHDSADSEIGLFYMRNNKTMLIFEGRGSSFTTFSPNSSELLV